MAVDMIPRLETRRLILRGWQAADFDGFAAIYGDADVMRFLGPVQSRSDAWNGLARTIGHWALRGYGTWAVERKADHALIGRVGLINPEGWPGLEVGWTLARAHWGHGFASEAASAALSYGFLTQSVDRLISCIDPGNHASQAVARRIGEQKGPRQDLVVGGQAYPVDIWSITRAEWERRSGAGQG